MAPFTHKGSVKCYLILSVWYFVTFVEPVSSQLSYGSLAAPVLAGPITLHSISDPIEGSWKVTDPSSNNTCILFNGKITVSVNYTDVNNVTRITELEVPSTAQASGSCRGAANEQNIILSWMQPNASQPHGTNNSLTFEFFANETSKNVSINAKGIPVGKFALVKVTAVINKDVSLFPNATNPTVPFIMNINDLMLLPTTINHSYACQSVISLEGTDLKPSQKLQLTVLLRSVQIEAFRTGGDSQEKGNNSFSPAEHCAADEISSGSLVGTVIVALLVIVLIALGAAALTTYLRRRRAAAASSGYENM